MRIQNKMSHKNCDDQFGANNKKNNNHFNNNNNGATNNKIAKL